MKSKGFIDWNTKATRTENEYKDRNFYRIEKDLNQQNDNSVAAISDGADAGVQPERTQASAYNKDYEIVSFNTESSNNKHSNENHSFIDDESVITESTENYIDVDLEDYEVFKDARMALEGMNKGMSVEEREDAIKDVFYHESKFQKLVETLPERKKGYVPVFMDDAYYCVNDNARHPVSLNVLDTYFKMKMKGNKVSDKLFESYKRILMYDARIETNHQFIQWYKR